MTIRLTSLLSYSVVVETIRVDYSIARSVQWVEILGLN